MAVAAQAKTFCLYSLKSMGDMEEEIKRNAEICPVKDVSFLLNRQGVCSVMLIL